MALPRKLKNMNLFNDGATYLGQIGEVTLPKLSRNMEDWRGGGMNAPIKIDQGMEGLELEAQCGGFMRDVFAQFGPVSMFQKILGKSRKPMPSVEVSSRRAW